jgi:thiazole synthase
MAACHEASGAEVVTVAVRRVRTSPIARASPCSTTSPAAGSLLLPNTAACYNADEAIRAARLGREVGLSHWVKLEVVGDPESPGPRQRRPAPRRPACSPKRASWSCPSATDDLISARKLIDAGAAAVMPLAAPIGSGLGIQNLTNLRILRGRLRPCPSSSTPALGTASDAVIAMELGYDGILMNTAIAEATDAPRMAAAMNHAVHAGRLAFEAGRHARLALQPAPRAPRAGIQPLSPHLRPCPGLAPQLPHHVHGRPLARSRARPRAHPPPPPHLRRPPAARAPNR